MDLLIRDILLTPINAAGDLATKSWYSSNFRAIRELVQDPNYRADDVDPYEPVIEVVIGDATIQETNDFVTPTFVRVSMDGENVGETSLFKHGPYTKPVWNERFLLHPRGSFSMRFEVIDHREHLRGQCTIGTQSLWGAAGRTGGLSIKPQLTLARDQICGQLTVHCRPWDGLPPERPWWQPAGDDALKAEPDLFDMLDKDGDGVLSKEELQAAIMKSKSRDMSPMSRQLPSNIATVPPVSVQGGAPLLLPISSRSSLKTQSLDGSLGGLGLGGLGPMHPAVAPGMAGMVSSLHPGGISVRSQPTISQPGSPLSIPHAVASPVKPDARAFVTVPPQGSPVRNASMSLTPVDAEQRAYMSLPAQVQSDDALGPAVLPRSSGRSRHLEARRVSPEKDMPKTSPAVMARLKAAGFRQ